MKRFFIAGFVFILLISNGFCAEKPKAPVFYTPEQIAAKNRDMESLNLIRSLELSTDQMQKLLPLLYEARLQEHEVFLGYKKDSLKAMKMLNMLEEKIYKDKGIDVPTEESVWFALGTLYEYEYDRYTSMQRQIARCRKILNENQLQLVAEYMPCIIPWASVKAPRRIGQAGSIEKLEKILDRLRTLKGKKYQEEKRLYLVELDWRLRIDRHEEDRTRQILVREIDSRIDAIMKLSDEEYQIKETELAQTIRPPDLEILPPRTGDDLDEYLGEYVLNPANIKYVQLQLKKAGVKYSEPKDIIDDDVDTDVDID